MTNNKPLREQVVSAIVNEVRIGLDKDYEIKGVTGIFEAADAAIKTILKKIQYKTYKHWRTDEIFGDKHCAESIIEWPLDNFGCSRWEQKLNT